MGPLCNAQHTWRLRLRESGRAGRRSECAALPRRAALYAAKPFRYIVTTTAPPRPILCCRATFAPATVETQYVFPSRKAFDTYLRDHAPALRADGLSHFPPETGLRYERQVAEIAAELE